MNTKSDTHGHFPFSRIPSARRTRLLRYQNLTYGGFSPPTLKLYWRLMRRGIRQERYEGADIFQSGGDFLLDRDGNVRYAHRSIDPTDRPTVTELLQQIDQLR